MSPVRRHVFGLTGFHFRIQNHILSILENKILKFAWGLEVGSLTSFLIWIWFLLIISSCILTMYERNWSSLFITTPSSHIYVKYIEPILCLITLSWSSVCFFWFSNILFLYIEWGGTTLGFNKSSSRGILLLICLLFNSCEGKNSKLKTGEFL